MTVGYVRQIIPFSAVDGPGNRTVIFFQGCNMKCVTCHNPETIPVHHNLEAIGVEAVVASVLRYRSFIDGVTITGGECTLQKDFLHELCKALNGEGISVLIDSNGLMIEVFELIKPYISGVMLDVKSADESEHLWLTGVPFSSVAQNAKQLLEWGLVQEVRTVVHPDLCWQKTLAWVSDLIKPFPEVRYKVIGFRPHGVKGDWKDNSIGDSTFMDQVKRELIALDVRHPFVVR